MMADERDSRRYDDRCGNREPNPDSRNDDGRNRRNEGDIKPYVYDPHCDDPIERFVTAYNLRNPPENHISGATRIVADTENG